jgi:hypothetical protein
LLKADCLRQCLVGLLIWKDGRRTVNVFSSCVVFYQVACGLGLMSSWSPIAGQRVSRLCQLMGRMVDDLTK